MSSYVHKRPGFMIYGSQEVDFGDSPAYKEIFGKLLFVAGISTVGINPEKKENNNN